eukprot:6401124-Heterocapsa_arctica.AAC.1
MRNQILAMNSLDPLSPDADDLWAIILADSANMFGHDQQTQVHPSGHAVLNKFFYRHFTGVERVRGQINNDE